MTLFDGLTRPPAGHGLQAMMQRWEQIQPVNAVQVAGLDRRFLPEEVQTATTATLDRLLARDSGLCRGIPDTDAELFEFQHRLVLGSGTGPLEQLVTDELNTPFSPEASPFRVTLLDVGRGGQFLALAYRHLIADARSTALLLNEILRRLAGGVTTTDPGAPMARRGGDSIRGLFPGEFGWGALPRFVRSLANEWWQSQWCRRLSAADPRDLRMEFRIHQTDLPLAGLKAQCHRLGGTVNDLLIAAILDWCARRLGAGTGWRRDLAVATLVDLCGRASPPQPEIFGQFLAQFVVRAPVRPGQPFADVVRLTTERTRGLKHVAPLVQSARAFEILSRMWDLFPPIRHPAHLADVLPLMGGVSNVNLQQAVGPRGTPALVRSYLRGTCVTNVLPMIVSLTTLRDVVSLTTTHRPALFSAQDMHDLSANIVSRLWVDVPAAIRAAA